MSEHCEINKIVADYMKYENLYSGENLDSFLLNERKRFDVFLQDIQNFYIFSGFLLDTFDIDFNKDTIPLMSLYIKAALSLFAIVTCLGNGLLAESFLITRTIFENWLTVKVIFEDSPLDHLELYRDYEHVEHWLAIERHYDLVSKGLLEMKKLDEHYDPELRKQVKVDYEKIKDNYHPKIPYHWAWKLYKDKTDGRNPSVRFLAERFGALRDYYQIYSSSSAIAHSSPVIKNLMEDGGDLSLLPNFPKLIISEGLISLNYCCMIVQEIVSFVIPDKSTEINEYIEKSFAETLFTDYL